ncbi:MAG: hypothetical protein DI586_08180 [Micavibrio aeruginosavorus]|uniref:Uncharacterized protein n=1 Tax=Micavibrio aeruginosavorus TaxID=349221 RepID=A0A2W5FKT4_9BACT|nr:MAG: hypothetical protein DI586_08180 [Micavibrio aeruginosavorus]
MILNMLRKPTRYLHLSGDPVGYPKPVKILLRGEFMVAALATASFAQLEHNSLTVQALIGSALGIGFSAKKRNAIETAFRKRNDLKDKVINKEPSDIEVTASVKHRLMFNELGRAYFRSNLFDGLVATASITPALAGVYMPLLATWTTSAIAYNVSQVYNFRKLAKGDWALTDEPPKNTALDHLKSKAPEIKLVPQAA